jgi:hypothetical protein
MQYDAEILSLGAISHHTPETHHEYRNKITVPTLAGLSASDSIQRSISAPDRQGPVVVKAKSTADKVSQSWAGTSWRSLLCVAHDR